MSVMDMNSRMAMAEKLSVQQLQQAIQSGSLPAYIGIPLIEQKNKEKSQMAAAQQGQQKPPSVAASILQQAEQQEQQEQGISQLPSNLPIEGMPQGMAEGGIVAFAGDSGSLVRSEPQYSSEPVDDPEYQRSIEVPKGALSGWFRDHMEKIRKQNEASAAARGQPITLSPVVVTPETATPEPDSLAKPEVLGSEFGVQGVLPSRETGQRNQGNPNAPTGGAPNAPTARQTVQPNQAPAAQPEGQSALDKYAAMLMAEREGSGKERDKAKGMALLQAGLGIMGGTSPNAFANIAQGALPATQAYQQSIKGIRAEDSARLKELMGLGVSKEKLALEAKKLGISEKRFNQMYELETQKLGIMGGQRADLAAERNELARERRIDTMFKNIQGTPWAIGRSPSEILRAAQEAVNAGRDVQETPAAPSGVTVRRIS